MLLASSASTLQRPHAGACVLREDVLPARAGGGVDELQRRGVLVLDVQDPDVRDFGPGHRQWELGWHGVLAARAVRPLVQLLVDSVSSTRGPPNCHVLDASGSSVQSHAGPHQRLGLTILIHQPFHVVRPHERRPPPGGELHRREPFRRLSLTHFFICAP